MFSAVSEPEPTTTTTETPKIGTTVYNLHVSGVYVKFLLGKVLVFRNGV